MIAADPNVKTSDPRGDEVAAVGQPAPPPPVRRGNRRGQGARLRTELLDAADAVLEGSGDPGRLSLRAVAESAGVATTSIYLHFADLAALKAAVAQRGFQTFAQARDAACAGITDPLPALLTRCDAYCQHALAHPGQYRLMYGPHLATLTPAEPGAPSELALQSLEHSISQCQRSGACPTHTDPARLALLVWTALHGQMCLRLDRPLFPWPPVQELTADLVHHLLGIRATDETFRP
ncbi:MAG: TetR/AcrR family transcriptional regulator [Lapillicoccus sp.]